MTLLNLYAAVAAVSLAHSLFRWVDSATSQSLGSNSDNPSDWSEPQFGARSQK